MITYSDMNYNLSHLLLSPHAGEDKIAQVDNSCSISYQNLYNKTQRFANWIKNKKNLIPGDRVVLIFPDSIETTIAFLGTIWAGGIPCIINAQAHQANLDYKLEQIKPKFVFDKIDLNYLNESNDIEPVFSCYEDVAFLTWTSGSGGNPKAVMVSHGPMLEAVKNNVQGLALTKQDTIYCTARFFFLYGVCQTILNCIRVGATSIIDNRPFTPARIETNIKHYRPTLFLSVPTIYTLILDCSPDTFLHTRCISSGDILPDTLNNHFQEKFGRGIHNGFGASEVLHLITLNTKHDSAIGHAFPGWETRIVDSDGQPVSTNEIGFLQIKTKCHAAGYWNDIENTQKVLNQEWITLGDLVRHDIDGVLTFVSRYNDAVKFNGQYVDLTALEMIFLSHPSVNEAAVVGVTDKFGKTKITAYLVAKKNQEISLTEVTNWLSKSCTLDYFPRKIQVVQELPRNENKKIDRRSLKQNA